MKKIMMLLIFLSITSLNGYTLKFYNQTDYPLQAVLTFEPRAKCKTILVPIRPQSPNQLPREIKLECCAQTIKIKNMSGDMPNSIEYDYQQPKNDEGACIDTAITITRRSDGLLEIK